MAAWTSDELTTIGAAEELQIAPRRGDGLIQKLLNGMILHLDEVQ
jgi:hypothetical protein